LEEKRKKKKKKKVWSESHCHVVKTRRASGCSSGGTGWRSPKKWGKGKKRELKFGREPGKKYRLDRSSNAQKTLERERERERESGRERGMAD
jgi:hypothetical protein